MRLIYYFENDINLLFGCTLLFKLSKDLVCCNIMLFLEKFDILLKSFGWHVYFGSFRLQIRLCLFLFLLLLIILKPIVLIFWRRIWMILKWSVGLFSWDRIWVRLFIVILRHCLCGIRIYDKRFLIAGVFFYDFERFWLDFALFVHLTLKKYKLRF